MKIKRLGGLTKDQIMDLRLTDQRLECITCGEILPLKSFSYGKSPVNGKYYVNSECGKCGYKRKMEKHGHKWESYNATQLHKQRHTIDGRAAYLIYGVKRRCLKCGYEFDLTKEFVIDKLKAGICEVTGITLDCENIEYKPYAPSLDRIDSAKGYTQNNVQLVCMIYNFCKNKFTTEQVDKFFNDIRL